MWLKIRDYAGIAIGSLITALGLVLFLVPNKIADGGFTGLATIFYYLFHFKVGYSLFLLNVPIFLLSLKELGLRTGIKTIFGISALSIFVELFSALLTPPTHNLILATVYGGVISGLGLGIVFRFGGTTGGTDLAARLINKYLKLSIGKSLLAIDAVVITLAAIVFNVELGLYGFLVIFLSAKVIDLLQEGEEYFKAALIVSEKRGEIGRAIMHDLGRGVTYLQGIGGYTGEQKGMLMVVFSRNEQPNIIQIVSGTDPKAFVIVANVHEALGEGFKSFS
ncbi:YitT family protein [Bacillota bacterium LX-D]|nr:YitT family protein [Bacillota bacterium LX-D]